MKIRSKVSGRELYVTDRMWKNMKAAGATNTFEVVPDEQPVLNKDVGERSLPSREQMLAALRERGIRTATNIGQDKLTERYKLNI